MLYLGNQSDSLQFGLEARRSALFPAQFQASNLSLSELEHTTH